MYADKYAHQPSDIPKSEHWVILEGSSVTIPGDERSRTNPGHGYPESTERFMSYEVYLTKEKFEAALSEKLSSRWGKPCVGIHVAGVMDPEPKISFQEKR